MTEGYMHDLQIPIEITAQVALQEIETILPENRMCGQDRGLLELLHTDPDGVNVPASAWAGIVATLLSSGRIFHNLLSFQFPSWTQAHAVSLQTRNMKIFS